MDIHIKYNSPNDPLHISQRKRDTKTTMRKYHSHVDHYEIYYLINGKRKYFIKDKTYYIESGNLVFINKGDLHRTFPVDDYEHERLLINFTEDCFFSKTEQFISILQFLFKQTRIIHLNKQKKQEFEYILHKMVREIKDADEAFNLFLKSLLSQFLISSVRYLKENTVRTQELTGSTYHAITDIIHYIDEHYQTSNLSLESVASNFFISPSYLSRIFQKVTGFTYSEYINHVRIQKAQKLLQESKMKVIDIAGEVGFNSLTHFGRVFKNNTHYTPSAYRKIYMD